jgi:hypothetical protein
VFLIPTFSESRAVDLFGLLRTFMNILCIRVDTSLASLTCVCIRKVVPVFNYARRREDVWESECTESGQRSRCSDWLRPARPRGQSSNSGGGKNFHFSMSTLLRQPFFMCQANS